MIDLQQVVKFLKIQVKGLKYLLSCKFHAFWSNICYRGNRIVKQLDSFLQFVSRPHDFQEFLVGKEAREFYAQSTTKELEDLRQQCIEHMFWVCVRMSKKSENHHEFLGEAFYREQM